MRYEALSPSPARAMTQTVPRKYIDFYRVIDGVIDGVIGGVIVIGVVGSASAVCV